MLVTGLAKQDPRPKRIGPLTLPLASFGDPLIAGVRLLHSPSNSSFCDIIQLLLRITPFPAQFREVRNAK